MENTTMMNNTNNTQNAAVQNTEKKVAKKRPPRKSNGAPQKKTESKPAAEEKKATEQKPEQKKEKKERKPRATSHQERLDRAARLRAKVVLNGTIEFETDETASRGAGSATVLYDDCVMFVKRRENMKPVRVIEVWTHVPMNDVLVSKKLFANLMESHTEFSGYMQKVNDKKSKSKLVFQLKDEDTLPFVQLLIDSI